MAQETKNENNGSVMKIVLIGFFAFLITVVIAGTVLFLSLKKPDVEKEAMAEKKPMLGPLVSVGNDIIVNLRPDEKGLERYLKVNVTLEVSNEKAQEELTARIPQVRDLIINILSRNTKEKIDEKEGKELIRSEIIKSINSHLVQGKVTNLFFQDFVIQ
ncbi:MAG TPA: flagellar basal body-associated FliL family protein [Bacillota bacterium]|nr:flagellar basal body-associated FliL family protein [Bacillota bacterium]